MWVASLWQASFCTRFPLFEVPIIYSWYEGGGHMMMTDNKPHAQ